MSRSIRWGILATGNIAKTFTTDLLVHPQTRGVDAFKHTVVAAASSNSASRARDFLKEVGASPDARGYGSYAELVNDPDVDIIYVSTPHSHHYQSVMLCLEAGKNVLCEKPFTVNAAQTKRLVAKAREKDLFLMEAVWTRYFPLSIYVRDLISRNQIGHVQRVFADNSVNQDLEMRYPDGKHRLVNPDLAGGALLDMGIYSLTWIFQTLYSTQPEGNRRPPRILSSIKEYKPTGVDEMTSILLTFPTKEGDRHGIATTQFRAASDTEGHGESGPAVRVQGDRGEIQIWPPIWRPTRTKLILLDGTIEEKHWPQPGPGKGSGWENGFGGEMHAEGEGHGMFWEADEAARALLEGKKESSVQSLDESIMIMEVMDEIRKQNDFSFPSKIESPEYPLQL
ncbi:hypothetical protein B7463_g3127, partial [Scytalidium lignicola]